MCRSVFGLSFLPAKIQHFHESARGWWKNAAFFEMIWQGVETNNSSFRKHFDEKSAFSACTFQNFPIFAPAILGEIGVARESAFFALFLDGESGQFNKKEVKRRGCFRCYVASNQAQHKQRSSTFIRIFLLWETRPNHQK